MYAGADSADSHGAIAETNRKIMRSILKILAKILYKLIIFPLIVVTAHILALFSARIRTGLLPRYDSVRKLAEWFRLQPPGAKIILIHAASMGEFEHVKPLLHHFKEDHLAINIVTF